MDHLVFPALLVGIANNGTTSIPTMASIQFCLNITIIATIRVMEFERILVRVLVIIC